MGFKEEGVFKDMIYGNGRYRSMVFMACINENEKMSVGLSPDKDKETLKIRM